MRAKVTILLATALMLATIQAATAFADELEFMPPTAHSNESTVARVDLQEQLQATFDLAARTGRNVRLPPGKFHHSSTLVLRGIRVRGAGEATILEGMTRDDASVVLTGTGSGLSDLKLTFPATTRSQFDASSLVLVQDATDFAVSNLVLDGSDSVGIFVSRSTRGIVNGNRVYNTLADSIHITGASSDITVKDNATYFSGDDGIAVVSYEKSGVVSNVSIIGNAVVDNKYARGISVVGGRAVQVVDNRVRCTAGYAGIYVASERYWFTYGAEDVNIERNSVAGCGSSRIGQGGITIFSDYNPNKQISVTGNRISSSPASGIIVLWGPNVDVSLEGNVIGSQGGEIEIHHQNEPIFVFGNTNEDGARVSARLVVTNPYLVQERPR